jgi:hypothetical protein
MAASERAYLTEHLVQGLVNCGLVVAEFNGSTSQLAGIDVLQVLRI